MLGRNRLLVLCAIFISIPPILLIANSIPYLITSDHVIEESDRSRYLVWTQERELGWTGFALLLTVLLILWIPFRRRELWSLLPMWVYVLGYLVPVHFFLVGRSVPHRHLVGLFADAFVGSGMTRSLALGTIVTVGSVVVLLVATIFMWRRRKVADELSTPKKSG